MSATPLRSPGFLWRGSKKGTQLFCEAVPVSTLAQRFGTPIYVYSQDSIVSRFRALDRAFKNQEHTLCYSVKANSNLSLLRVIAKPGAGFDVVSGGELLRVQRAGGRGAAARTVFSGVGKTAEEIDAALRAGILLFNVESEGELEVLARRASVLNKRARIAFRVNPDIPAETHPYISTGLREHKFGVPIEDAPRLYRLAARSRWLEVAGVSVHIGSQITSVAPFAAAMGRVANLVRELRGAGMKIKYVDAGGGLGISYEHPEQDFAATAGAYAEAVMRPLRGLDVHLLLEPGRAIVGPAGVLLTRVLYLKQNGGKKFAICDAAMNDLLRPALYSAYHQIVSVSCGVGGSEAKVHYDIVGPICETGDFFARDREMPELHEGDLLAILDTGAYGMALASNYNSRPRAAEVLVDGKKVKLIRKRESVSELIKAEL